MKKALLACLLMCACGGSTEKPQRVPDGDSAPRYTPGDETIRIELPVAPHVSISPGELSFYCAGDLDECPGPLAITITNSTNFNIVIQRPVIEEPGAFYLADSPEYPVFLAPYEEFKLHVGFWWTRDQQFATLTIETSEKTLMCGLSGKWFIF